MTKIAMCRRCQEPLVSTMMFRKAEFYCVNCGATYGYLEPVPATETPELLSRMDANRTEFENLAKGHIGDGAYHMDDCETCRTKHEPHLYHATPEELAEDQAARARLRDRAFDGVDA